jgi:hypothetical protein
MPFRNAFYLRLIQAYFKILIVFFLNSYSIKLPVRDELKDLRFFKLRS